MHYSPRLSFPNINIEIGELEMDVDHELEMSSTMENMLDLQKSNDQLGRTIREIL